MDRHQINPDINSKIIFPKVNPSDRGRMLYSVSIIMADAMSLVSKLASRDNITYVILLLRGIFKRAFNETKIFLGPQQQKT